MSIAHALFIETSGTDFVSGDGRGLGKGSPNLGLPVLANKNKIWILDKKQTSIWYKYVSNIAWNIIVAENHFVIYLNLKFNWTSCILSQTAFHEQGKDRSNFNSHIKLISDFIRGYISQYLLNILSVSVS